MTIALLPSQCIAGQLNYEVAYNRLKELFKDRTNGFQYIVRNQDDWIVNCIHDLELSCGPSPMRKMAYFRYPEGFDQWAAGWYESARIVCQGADLAIYITLFEATHSNLGDYAWREGEQFENLTHNINNIRPLAVEKLSVTKLTTNVDRFLRQPDPYRKTV